MKTELKRRTFNYYLRFLFLMTVLCFYTISAAQITVNEQNKSIRQVIRAIESTTDYNFFYNDDFDVLNKIVSVNVNNASVDEVLSIIFKDSGIKWESKNDNLIILIPDNLASIKKSRGNIPGGKTRTVTGKIVDDKGNSIIGATVKEKGTLNGTITNPEGHYKIDLSSDSPEILQYSYIGMETVEINTAGKNIVDVTLSDKAMQLSEVIVVGYGVQRRSDVTGAVASVKAAEALKNQPSTNISNTLQGSLAGVSVVSGSGDPSKEMTIRIRGVNSISSDNQPLIVVDGFMGGSLKSLNPSDIESIEVLKDASATAIYGSQGANGVILVTTKTPQKDKLLCSFNMFGSLQTVYKYPDILSPVEFAHLANAYGQEYFPTMPTPQPAKTFFTEDQIKAFENGTAGYDYVKAIFNDPALSQNYDLSISGGSDKTTYLASLRYAGSQGVIKQSVHDAVNYRLKLDINLLRWLKVGLNMYGDYSNSKGPRIAPYEGLLQTAINWPTTSEPINDDGNYNNVFPISGLAAYNPVGYINDIENITQSINNNLQTYFEVKINNDLKFRSQFGVAFTESLAQHTYNNKSYFFFKNNRTQAASVSDWNLSWLNTNILNYTKEFNQDHRINATAVLEQSYANYFSHQSTAEMLAFDLGYDALDWADKYYVSSVRTISTLLSEMVRVNYVFKNRYMFTASFRADGSSRLYEKWDYFPSFAMAWDISQEEFMKKIEIINQLKLRAGYGVVGNQAIAPYSIYSKMIPVVNSDGTTSYVVGRPASPFLKWERNEQLNAGIDMTLWNGRLTFTADWYNKVSKDILLNVAQPVHTGWPSLLKNAGEITNTGFEVTIGADPVAEKDFSWNTNLTLSHNKSIYSVIPTLNKMQAMGVAGVTSPLSIFQMIEGEKVASFYGYTNDGVWKSDEVGQSVTITNADGSTKTDTYKNIYKVVPGQVKIRDLNNDGKLDVKDQGIIGCGQPAINWGWNNTIKYREFDISLFLVGFHGFDIYNATDQSGYPSSLNGVAQDVITPKRAFLNRWTAGNENTDVPGFVYVSSPLQGFTTQFVENGDFVKIKSITLGYNLTDNICRKMGIAGFRIYVSVQNPVMFTKYSGLDPESTLGSPLTSGVDWGNYPNGRNYLAGLSFSF